MPFVSPAAAMPQPRRVVVAGPSGSGKTTACAQLGARLGIPHHEIDALYHGPGWQPRPQFRADVERFAASPEWVTEWQYGAVRDLLAERADLMVWLDLPRPVVLRQVVWRTFRRRVRREELWNGNREDPLRTFFTDPEHIVRWSWQGCARYPRLVADLAMRRPELPIVRITSRRQLRRFLDVVSAYPSL